jgi:hypothetical protein
LLCRCGQLTSVSQADHVILLLGWAERGYEEMG